MSDIYAKLAGMMGAGSASRPIAPGGWLFGDVLEAGQGELRIACGGLSLGQTELHVSADLSYTWTLDEGQANFLRAGDRVLVLVSSDMQDYYVLQKAVFYIRHADVLIIGGTSLTVYPAAGLIDYYRGNRLVLINKSATARDAHADLMISQPIGQVFEELNI